MLPSDITDQMQHANSDIKLVRASVGQSVIEDIKSGKSSLDDLSSKGSAFTNISQVS